MYDTRFKHIDYKRALQPHQCRTSPEVFDSKQNSKLTWDVVTSSILESLESDNIPFLIDYFAFKVWQTT